MNTEWIAIKADAEWEYADLVYGLWETNATWASLAAPDSMAAPLAREFFWDLFEIDIKAELDKWRRLGWEPAIPVKRESIKLRRSEYIEPKVTAIDVMMWIVTFSVAYFVRRLLGNPRRRYVIYRPLEFRVPMRRSR